MHEQFEETKCSTGIKRFIDGQQKDSEKKNAMYECFERPVKKQVKFHTHEGQPNSSFSSTSINALQSPVEQFKNMFPMPLCSEQVAEILSTLKQVFKTHSELYETPCNQVNLCISEDQSISKSIFKIDERPSKEIHFYSNKEHLNSLACSSSVDSLQPSIKQFNNSVPFCNGQSAMNFSKSEPVFKTLDEIPFDQIKFRGNERSSISEPVFKTLDETPFDQIELRTNKELPTSEPSFKSLDETPFDQIEFHTNKEFATSEPIFESLDERSFKQINSCGTKKSTSSTISSVSTNVPQPSKEILTKTISVPSHKEQNVQLLSKSELVSKTPTEPIERSFKNMEGKVKVKFCTNNKQSSSTLFPVSTNALQSSVKRFRHPVFLYKKQNTHISPKLKQTFIAPSFNANNEPQPPFQIKDIFIEMENGIRIISALGLPFIKLFAERIKSVVGKSLAPPATILMSVCRQFQCQFGFEFIKDPDSVINHEFFCVKFTLKFCLISCVTSIHKNKTKALCAEAAMNTLVKLSILGDKPLYKYRPADTISRKINDMEICELFYKNIIKGIKNEPALMTVKIIAFLENIEDHIVFDVVSNVISVTVTEHTCKFLINDTLISYATNEASYVAKCIAAELGIIKLSNLPKYVIHKGELKRKLHRNNKAFYLDTPSSKINSDFIQSNSEKPPFILNSTLFNSSLKDGVLVIEGEEDKTDIHKPSEHFLSKISTFCQKEYCVKFEDVSEAKPPYRKARVFIGETEVGAGVNGSTVHAKTIAITKACINMKMKYYTLKIKDGYIEGFLVTRDQVYNGEPYFKNALKNNYVELKKIDKKFHLNLPEKSTRSFIKFTKEQSLNTDKNAGPFFSSNLNLFRSKIEAMLKHFKESEDYCDLLFSEECFVAETNEIIKTCKSMEICYQWLNADENKLLCVRHKYEVSKLLKYLVKNGGSNDKFELIDASETII